MICYFVNRRNVCAKGVVCKELQNGDMPLFEKSGAKTFLWDFVARLCANRVNELTQNNFEGILTGALKIEDLLLYK